MAVDRDVQEELDMLRQRVAELEGFEARCAEAESALNEVGNQWEGLLDIVGDSVFIVSYGDIIIDANTHAARRLGYTLEELRAIPYSSIEFREITDEQRAKTRESRFSGTRFYECLHKRKDGTKIPVEVSSRLVKYRGDLVVLNFARDIAERKQIEAEREALIRELDAYAHTVAHDLKNPVSLMLGFSSVLKDDHRRMNANEIDHDLERIFEASVKMNNIIDELLLLASLRKIGELRTGTIDMQFVVDEALNRVHNLIQKAGGEVRQEGNWPAADGYAAWIEEVWVNYLSNAVKYGGTPPLIELGGYEDRGMAVFWVRDNGRGISEADQAQLFETFTRFDQACAEGHGLGLSIVKSIIEKLGGQVWVESTPGEGSTFYFSLPAAH